MFMAPQQLLPGRIGGLRERRPRLPPWCGEITLGCRAQCRFVVLKLRAR